MLTTTSGRGVIPESHPLSLPDDAVGADVKPLNELIRDCDLVLVVGARLSDNGTRGGVLVLPRRPSCASTRRRTCSAVAIPRA